jgi:MFS superfamily sulfate permease-like transporter
VTSAVSPAGATSRQNTFVRDFTASIVVFLVAMPLCMGIAVASGVPPEKGLITGIIGGIIVGALAGSPLQVSGPAAGLAVIVFELVRQHGMIALGPILLIAGAIQVAAGAAKLGGWFRAISPAVVHGMLAGIGVLILVSQFHVLFDDSPKPSGVSNLLAIPAALLRLVREAHATGSAFAMGALTIAAMLAWERFRPSTLRLVPGALIGVTLSTLVAFFMQLDVVRVNVPESIFASLSWPTVADFTGLLTPGLVATAVAVAFIASAETLISAAAVDRMHDGPRTDYDKELRAQGVGNFLCGAVGALPMTGVIVRSSANVQAGAMTRASTIMHGIWIFAFVLGLPWLLREIPMAALAGILVVTGWRLVSLEHARHLLHHYGAFPAVIWATTLIMVVTTDLLTGVLTGFALSLIELAPHFRNLKLNVKVVRNDENHVDLQLRGSATFVNLPKMTKVLESLPNGGLIRLDVAELAQVDHTCAEVLADWIQRKRRAGTQIELVGANESTTRGHYRRLAEAATS